MAEPRGGEALAVLLRRNAAVTGLDVGLNRLGGRGAAALAAALDGNASLASLDLHANHVTLEGGRPGR